MLTSWFEQVRSKHKRSDSPSMESVPEATEWEQNGLVTELGLRRR